MKDPLGLGRMRSGRNHVSAKRGYVGDRSNSQPCERIVGVPWGPATGLRRGEASVLPYAMGRRALLFLEACRAACATATTIERSFQDGERNTVGGQKLEKIREEDFVQK